MRILIVFFIVLRPFMFIIITNDVRETFISSSQQYVLIFDIVNLYFSLFMILNKYIHILILSRESFYYSVVAKCSQLFFFGYYYFSTRPREKKNNVGSIGYIYGKKRDKNFVWDNKC